MNLYVEHEGINVAVSSFGDGTYALFRHDVGGGFLATDQSIEIQGYRMQCHNNGDGTFSLITTTSTASTDPQIEVQGILLRIHPTGNNDPVTGEPMYSFVVVND